MLFCYMSRPKIYLSASNQPQPQYQSQLNANLNLKSKKYDRAQIEQYSENKSYLSIWGDSKTVLSPTHTPKISH